MEPLTSTDFVDASWTNLDIIRLLVHQKLKIDFYCVLGKIEKNEYSTVKGYYLCIS